MLREKVADALGWGRVFSTNQAAVFSAYAVAGGDETPIIPDFEWTLPGYWTLFSDGIYYVARERLSDTSVGNHLKFFDFAHQRSLDLGTLAGTIDDWAGGLTVSLDPRTVLYSHRTYESKEIMLVEKFR